MQTEIICTAITAIATIVCAGVGAIVSRSTKEQKEYNDRVEKRAELRAQESTLNLKMLNANSQLTIGVAMALKRGHCNGEVEEGLKAVQDANKEYTEFLEKIALEKISK